MDIKHIHTDQLLNTKKAIEPHLYQLKTHVGHTLFGKKDFISPNIAIAEAKARMLITHYGLSAEQVVDRVSQFLLMPLAQYVEGPRTIKSFLLHSINYILDRMMGDLRKKETIHVPKSIQAYRDRELDAELTNKEISSDECEAEVEFFDGIETRRPKLLEVNKPIVVLRRRKTDHEIRNIMDQYEDF